MKDSIHYNQVSGKEMKAYFINGDMRHIEVIGNVLTAFYPEEMYWWLKPRGFLIELNIPILLHIY
mgnify:CR=1 FL=1